jgi:hypothetical protein
MDATLTVGFASAIVPLRQPGGGGGDRVFVRTCSFKRWDGEKLSYKADATFLSAPDKDIRR